MRIAQVRTCQRAQVGATRGDDAVHLIGFSDIAYGDGRNCGFITDAIAIGRLIHAAVDRLGVFGSLSSRDVDDVATGSDEGARDRDSVITADSAFDPIGCGDADGHWLLFRPDCAHGPESL